MDIISTVPITDPYKLRHVVGKKVIATNGQIVGRVTDIAYSMSRVLGIYVGDTLIGRDYIYKLSTESIILKINPVTKLKGKVVFDKDGKKVGRVAEVHRTGTANDFTHVVVKIPFAKAIKIAKADIDVIGRNIILNKAI